MTEANSKENEQLAAKPLALDYLASLVRDPEADPKRRDRAATVLTSLATGARREPSSNSLSDSNGSMRLGDLLAQIRDVKVAAPAASNHAPSVGSVFTAEVLQALAKAIVPFVQECISEAVAPLAQRIAELEARGSLKYCGVWSPEKSYAIGDFCTDHGSMWHCRVANCGSRPGSSDDWQLAVQRGQDRRR
jgi:hypothetical protein